MGKRLIFEEKRKNKMRIQPNAHIPTKITRLDKEANEAIVKKVLPESVEYKCFRCGLKNISTNQFEWSTSEGKQIICGGCNGFLIAWRNNKRPDPIKQKQKKTDAFLKNEKRSEKPGAKARPHSSGSGTGSGNISNNTNNKKPISAAKAERYKNNTTTKKTPPPTDEERHPIKE